MLNQRGQEFSVFKLLISAIVAIVILTLLLQVLGIINFDPNTNPASAAENLLKDMDNSVYQEKVSDRINFEKEHSIGSAALASEIGLSQNQICLAVEEGLSDFDVNPSLSLITYSGDSTIRVKLAGICGPFNDFSNADLIGTSTSVLSSKGFDFDSSGCSSVCIEDQRCCILFLYRSDE